MDKTIRKNEICVIGLPRCDFVFSSTRTCFIAYGFEESSLEMDLLKKLLEEEGIQPIEAGGSLAPAQSAFCAKICSKIITSQFCIVLINNDEKNGSEIPNANVNMEYGLMLGFNKYVIPFQKESQKLPFNVAGLDTIKYNSKNFKDKAISAIKEAVKLTNQETNSIDKSDQILELFILNRNYLWAQLDNDGEKNIFRLGSPLGFNLLHDFPGDKFVFIDRFTMLRPEVVLWRLRKLNEILNGRRSSLPSRVTIGTITPELFPVVDQLFSNAKIWVVVTSNEDKISVQKELEGNHLDYCVDIISLDDVMTEINSIVP